MEKSVEKKTRAMGTQKLVAIVAMVALFIFFSIFGKGFFKYSTIVSEMCIRDRATTLGAAILAGVGVGVYDNFAQAVKETIVITREHKPDMEKHRLYQKSMELYL